MRETKLLLVGLSLSVMAGIFVYLKFVSKSPEILNTTFKAETKNKERAPASTDQKPYDPELEPVMYARSLIGKNIDSPEVQCPEGYARGERKLNNVFDIFQFIMLCKKDLMQINLSGNNGVISTIAIHNYAVGEHCNARTLTSNLLLEESEVENDGKSLRLRNKASLILMDHATPADEYLYLTGTCGEGDFVILAHHVFSSPTSSGKAGITYSTPIQILSLVRTLKRGGMDREKIKEAALRAYFEILKPGERRVLRAAPEDEVSQAIILAHNALFENDEFVSSYIDASIEQTFNEEE